MDGNIIYIISQNVDWVLILVMTFAVGTVCCGIVTALIKFDIKNPLQVNA